MQGAGAGDAANNAHVPAGEADLAPAHSASCFPGQIAGDRADNSPPSGTAGAGGDDEVDVGPRVVAAVTGMPSQEEIVRIVAALGDAAEAAEAAAAAASQGEGAAEGGSAGNGMFLLDEEPGTSGQGTRIAGEVSVSVAGELESVARRRQSTAKLAKKSSLEVRNMARRVTNWGIVKPKRAVHTAWNGGLSSTDLLHQTAATTNMPCARYVCNMIWEDLQSSWAKTTRRR
jgi:hypothetical protein